MSEEMHWRRVPIGTKLLAGLAGAVAAGLLVLLVVLVHRATAQRDAALARTEHSFAVVLAANQVQATMARAEAALGRFVTDADPRTGTIYYDEWRHAGERLDELRALVRDDPAQSACVDRLQTLYAARGRELALPAARANYRQGWNALGLYYQIGRSKTLPEIGRLLDQVTNSESERLGRRATTAAARTDHSNGLTRLLSLVGLLLAGSVVTLGWTIVRIAAERRVARELAEKEADRAALLEQAVALRTAELRTANERLEQEAATRAEAEAMLRQVQKMEAVGQLTGGIAHDFNNMLAVVLGGLEMAKRRVTAQADEARRHIDSALNGAERAAALTRRLLSFARAQPLLSVAADPGVLLRGMSDLLDRTLGERIEVRILVDTEVWPVWVDTYQLENAILNLAVNARDAMGGTGTLVMSAANVRPTEARGVLPPGDYVRLAVVDSGEGMTSDVLERVFEPFFTTKPAGEGTGLGLSQILGFARQSGGDVAITSRPGEGTTVEVLLPRYRAAPDTLASGGDGAEATAAGDGLRLLLVEDDTRVREATATALEELGHAVVACSSGREALTRLRDGLQIDLLVTDVVMPGMTGVELVQEVRVRRPDLPVLFVTGYAGDTAEADGFRGGVVLRKPFTLRALGNAVTAALNVEAVPADPAVSRIARGA